MIPDDKSRIFCNNRVINTKSDIFENFRLVCPLCDELADLEVVANSSGVEISVNCMFCAFTLRLDKGNLLP